MMGDDWCPTVGHNHHLHAVVEGERFWIEHGGLKVAAGAGDSRDKNPDGSDHAANTIVD
jgi:hypothetical protein